MELLIISSRVRRLEGVIGFEGLGEESRVKWSLKSLCGLGVSFWVLDDDDCVVVG